MDAESGRIGQKLEGDPRSHIGMWQYDELHMVDVGIIAILPWRNLKWKSLHGCCRCCSKT